MPAPNLESQDSQNLSEAVDHIRKTFEAYGEESHDFKQAMENTNDFIATQDDINQKNVLALQSHEKKAMEQEERINELERSLVEAQKKNIHLDVKDTPEYKALNRAMSHGEQTLTPEQKATLRGDNSTQGGFLTVPEMDDVILKNITELSPVRQVARVKSVGSKTLQIPSRETIPLAEYEGEAAQNVESTSSYGAESLTVYRVSVTVPYTEDLLLDSQFDLMREIENDVMETFAQREGRAFVSGTGSKQPEGFLSDSSLTTNAFDSTSGTSGEINGDDLLALTGEVKTGYKAVYAFNSRTLARIRRFKGSDGHFIWQQSFAARDPSTIAGANYILLEDMPDLAAGSFSVVYADFKRGYTIIDFAGMQMIRDEVTMARQAIILLTFRRWNYGQVTRSEAFKLLRTAS